MNIDFCENIDIKYDYDYNYLRNLLDNYVYFVEELLLAKNRFQNMKKKLANSMSNYNRNDYCILNI
jgi:hypothetical protein